MAESPTPSLTCRHCGNTCSAPRWEREYLCPACFQPFTAAPLRASQLRLGWIAGVVVALGATGVVAGAVANRGTGFTAAPDLLPQFRPQLRAYRSPIERPDPVPRPSGDMEGLLREKIRYIQEDLKIDPGHVELRVAHCRAYMALAVVTRESDAGASQRWLTLARQEARRLRLTRPSEAVQLEEHIDNAPRLRWVRTYPVDARELLVRLAYPQASVALPSGNELPSSALGLYQEANTGRTTPGGGPFRNGMGNGPIHPVAPYDPFGAPTPDARPSAPGNTPNGAPVPPGGGDRPPVRPPFAMLRPDAVQHPTMRSALPGAAWDVALRMAPISSGDLDRLRREVRADPADMRRTALLARALYGEAGRAKAASPERSSQYLREALSVLRRSAKHVRLRMHRGVLYVLAAETAGDLRDWELQYQLSKTAVQHIPYSPTAWRALQRVALKTGRATESGMARRQSMRWELPDLRR